MVTAALRLRYGALRRCRARRSWRYDYGTVSPSSKELQ
jgi:hypothetical protein